MSRLVKWRGSDDILIFSMCPRLPRRAASCYAWLGVACIFAVLPAYQANVSAPSRGTRFVVSVSQTVARKDSMGGRQRYAGMEVYTQLGCGACHRIGDRGRRGPGPALRAHE